MKHLWGRTDNGKFMVLNDDKNYVVRNTKTTKGWLWVADKVMGYEETTNHARAVVESFYELNEDDTNA